MFQLEVLKNTLIVSMILSSVTCSFIQKTKKLLKSSKWITIYSFIINMITSIFFCKTFTNFTFPNSLWIGLFSFIGADSIYKTLEGKIATYTSLTKKGIWIPEENLINKEEE